MKKKVLLQSLLIVLPILAVGLATTTNSVTVFNTLTGETQYYSYFDVLPVTNLPGATTRAVRFLMMAPVRTL